jgi:acetyl-CoA C-acetyltransferase
MHKDVFLIGSGQTRFGEHWERSLRDLIQEAVKLAIDSSPCTSLDIDVIVVANMLAEAVGNQAHLGALTSSLLPHHPPALRVEAACASGSVAIHTACALLESGKAKNVLVVGAEKMTDVPVDVVSSALMGAADAEVEQPSGLTFPGMFGLIAKRYLHEYPLTRDDLSIVSAVHHRQAMQNPFAQFRSEIPVAAISRSAPVADPLRLLDCSPVSDGAAACILSTEHKSDMRVAASQLATDTLSLVNRPTLTSFAATKEAGAKALEEASIPLEELRCVELHDCFSIAALISLEDLGFSAPGEGVTVYRELYDRPATARCSVNRSGGLKACGHPVAATGVKQIIDVAKGLVAEGGRYGLAQNFGGAGATCCVHILEHNT